MKGNPEDLGNANLKTFSKPKILRELNQHKDTRTECAIVQLGSGFLREKQLTRLGEVVEQFLRDIILTHVCCWLLQWKGLERLFYPYSYHDTKDARPN